MIGLERLGVWITKNPVIIIAVAVLLTLVSVNYAQQVESSGMTTESFVSKDSALYQLYDHLYGENFGADANVILIEGDDVAKADALSASLRLSDHMKQVPNVISVQSIADIVADAEYQSSGIRPYSFSGEDRRDPGRRRLLNPWAHARSQAYQDDRGDAYHRHPDRVTT